MGTATATLPMACTVMSCQRLSHVSTTLNQRVTIIVSIARLCSVLTTSLLVAMQLNVPLDGMMLTSSSMEFSSHKHAIIVKICFFSSYS
jgi:hypothetical protein